MSRSPHKSPSVEVGHAQPWTEFFFVSLRLEGRCIEQEEKCPSKKERDGHSWGTGDGRESIHALVLLANGRTEHWVWEGGNWH